EDGIRDFHVTGIQTCALPIYRERQRVERTKAVERYTDAVEIKNGRCCSRIHAPSYSAACVSGATGGDASRRLAITCRNVPRMPQIGRASRRERVRSYMRGVTR